MSARPQQAPGPIGLRPVVEADLPRLHRWYQTPELAAHLVAEIAPRTEAEAVAFMGGWLTPRPEAERWAIVASASGHLLGLASLLEIDGEEAALHLFLGEPSARGRGSGRATMEALLDRAFHGLTLTRVRLEVLETNLAARRLYQSAGFVETSRQPNPVFKAGGAVWVVRMAVTAGTRSHR